MPGINVTPAPPLPEAPARYDKTDQDRTRRLIEQALASTGSSLASISLAGPHTWTDTQSFVAPGPPTAGTNAIKLLAGNGVDGVTTEFYARLAALTTRTGWFGYTDASIILEMHNEILQGNIVFQTNPDLSGGGSNYIGGEICNFTPRLNVIHPSHADVDIRANNTNPELEWKRGGVVAGSPAGGGAAFGGNSYLGAINPFYWNGSAYIQSGYLGAYYDNASGTRWELFGPGGTQFGLSAGSPLVALLPTGQWQFTGTSLSTQPVKIQGDTSGGWYRAALAFVDLASGGHTYVVAARDGTSFALSDETTGDYVFIVDNTVHSFKVRAGGSNVQQARVGGAVYGSGSVTRTSSADGSLAAYAYKAHTLDSATAKLRATVRGSATTETCTVKIVFGATTLLNRTYTAGQKFTLNIEIMRDDGTSTHTVATVRSTIDGTPATVDQYVAAPSDDTATDLTLDFRGNTATGAGTLAYTNIQVEVLDA